jgi:hypothetical protein
MLTTNILLRDLDHSFVNICNKTITNSNGDFSGDSFLDERKEDICLIQVYHCHPSKSGDDSDS